MDKSRRNFLAIAGMVPVAVLAGRAGAQSPKVCYDTASLPAGQKSLRRSMQYVDVSPDAKRRCGGCAFFTAGQEGCGTCALLRGGPVAATGFCTSFAPKS